jgi:RHS repeat-associated protein
LTLPQCPSVVPPSCVQSASKARLVEGAIPVRATLPCRIRRACLRHRGRARGGTEVTGQDTLGRDGWNRVTAVAYQGAGGGGTERFSFDRYGNVQVDGETRTYERGTRRLLSRDAGAVRSFRYDRAGNELADSLSGNDHWRYSYDALDRLVAARYNGTLVARYGYDVLGRRIAKRVYAAGPHGAAAAYVRMLYAGAHVVAEADSGGTLTLGYTWGLGVDNLVAVHTYGAGSGDWYAVQDHQHNVRGLVKRDGTWTASWQAESLVAGGLPFPVRYRWTGREFDQELNWYFFRSRHYDVTSFRFVQEDASGYQGGLNLYMYGDGDPTTGRDPDGLTKDVDWATAGNSAQLACVGTKRGCSSSDPDWGGGGGGGVLWDFDGDGVDDHANQGERDCNRRRCHDVERVLNSPEFRAVAGEWLRLSNSDYRERGSYILLRGDAVIIGPMQIGEPYSGHVDHAVPPPLGALAEFHTHPDITYPQGSWYPGLAPSGDDEQRGRLYHVVEIVVTNTNVYATGWGYRNGFHTYGPLH